MPLSHFYKCIFVHIPKTAGTSIEKILNTGTEKEFYSRTPPTLQHLSWKELKNKIDFDYSNYYKFTVVRNPYERIVSEYEWRRTASPRVLNGMTFEELVNNIDLLKPLIHWDSHLNTQSSFLIDETGNIASDIEIYKYENLSPLWDKLENITKIPKSYFPKASSSRRLTSDYYYTDALRKKVREQFNEDFVNFNYE